MFSFNVFVGVAICFLDQLQTGSVQDIISMKEILFDDTNSADKTTPHP